MFRDSSKLESSCAWLRAVCNAKREELHAKDLVLQRAS